MDLVIMAMNMYTFPRAPELDTPSWIGLAQR